MAEFGHLDIVVANAGIRIPATSDNTTNAVAFLASDDARLITSEHLSIDAGMQYF